MRLRLRWFERALLAHVLLAGTLALSGCLTSPPLATTGTLSYLALGDSYTIGEGVSAQARWPMQLAAAVRADDIALADPRIIATTGWTTDELDKGIDAAHVSGPYDFVSVLIGVNNQFRGRPVEDYRQQFDTLLERAIGFAGNRADRVLVLSIPDWGVTRFGQASGRDVGKIADELDRYNTAAQAICATRGVAFIDITALSRAHGSDAPMLIDDGLHPSAAMYALWTQAAWPVARRLLAR